MRRFFERPGASCAFFGGDRSRSPLRSRCLRRIDGEPRQTGPGPLPLLRQANGRRSEADAGRRRQRQRDRRRSSCRHDGMGVCRRLPLCWRQGYRPVATRRRSADICLDDRIRTRVSSGAAMAWNGDRDEARLDDAARAGWLYYVAGNTQDEIAHKLGFSRQPAQALVCLAVSKKLIKVRLDHPIASCMALAEALTKRYDLRYCNVVPSDPSSTSTVLGVAEAAAAYLERILRSSAPLVVALGT